jgi:hypothetical protein
MARRYSRDNRGRFASGGSSSGGGGKVGATARGGRLKTAGGNKRATQTTKAAAAKPSGTVAGKVKRNPAAAGKIGKVRAAAKPPAGSQAAKPTAPKAAKPSKAAKASAAPKATSQVTAKGQRLGGQSKKLEFQNFYHGTSKAAGKSIREGGYNASSDGFLGKGVYLSRAKKVASYYGNSSGSDGGTVLRHRVAKQSVSNFKVASFFMNPEQSKKTAQGLVKKGKVASLRAADDIQKVSLIGVANANKTLVKPNSTIRRSPKAKRTKKK